MNTRSISIFFLLPLGLFAQAPRDVAPLKYWPAPLYWQPNQTENRVRPEAAAASGISQSEAPPATTPAGALVFVGMTPCRLVDTRTGFGFSGAFGPPSLVGGATRSFPLQTSTTCTIPSNAQAYSLNLTIVPPAAMYYLTIWPVGASQPNVSTLNDLLGTVIANAAIVPAGNDGSGSVNVFVSNNTDFIMDINGYYAPQTGLTLTQGTVGAPSLSFAGDAGTGIYSSGQGIVNITSGGAGALSVGGTNGNTSVGIFALIADTTGINNTAIGQAALSQNTTGINNTAAGQAALLNNTAGNNNTGNGQQALFSNTIGNGNTASGAGALMDNTTGNVNTASGQGSLHLNTTGSNNTATGAQAMFNNTTGCCNTAMGQAALASNTTANANSAFGGSALQNNTTGSANAAMGQAALLNNTTGNNNSALGQNAMNANTTGCCNAAVGQAALYSNTGGNANAAVGGSALQNNTGGNQNAALGQAALLNNTTGSGNVALGQGALSANTTGNSNIAIGQAAGSSVAAGNGGNIEIGNPGGGGDSGVTRIGQFQTSFYVAGIYGITASGGIPVYINSSGQLGTSSSSRRYKEDIQDMGNASSGLLELRPVTFRYKQPYSDGSKPVDYGLIAEEVAQVYPDLVVKNADGQIETVQYQKLTPMLLNELQKQHAQIEEQATKMEQQSGEIRQLRAELAALKGVVSGTDK